MLSGLMRKIRTVAKQVLPTAMIAGGALLPIFDTQGTGYSFASSFGSGSSGLSISTRATDAAFNLKGNLKSDWWESGLLIAGGVAVHHVLRAVD